MTHGSLFSGIGGFELAAQWMGWDNIFHCEWNQFGQKVLKHHFPKSISYEDITKTDFSIHRGTIDILTGGFPCQPYSTAGKRLGKEDERHLWPEMLRAIREIEPRWVVGENVRGLVSWSGGLVFEEVCTDLEAQGYNVQPFLLPAASVNAPHRRDRIWFVAHANNARAYEPLRNNRERKKNDKRREEQPQFESWKNDVNGFTKNTDEDGWGSYKWQEEPGIGQQRNTCTGDNERLRADDDKIKSFAKSDKFNDATNSGCSRLEANNFMRESERKIEFARNDGKNVSADTNSKRIKECDIPEISTKQKFFDRTYNERGANWKNFPTVAPVCNGDDGLSDRLDSITFPKWRNESIKAGGNAIVPQVAHQIFKAIQEYEQHYGSRLQ